MHNKYFDVKRTCTLCIDFIQRDNGSSVQQAKLRKDVSILLEACLMEGRTC